VGFNISQLKADPERETKGVWVKEKEGLELLIARLGNDKYRKFLRGVVSKQKSKFGRRSNVSDEDVEERMEVAIAHHILLGWKNLDYKNEDGTIEKDIPYSPERALALFKEFPSFLDVVVDYASDMSLFRAEATEEDVKNS